MESHHIQSRQQPEEEKHGPLGLEHLLEGVSLTHSIWGRLEAAYLLDIEGMEVKLDWIEKKGLMQGRAKANF
jgi:hypothetical protein